MFAVLRAQRVLNLSWMDPQGGIGALQRAARKAGRRARFAAVFSRAMLLLPVPLGYAVLALTLLKALRLDAAGQRWLLGFGALPLLVFLVGVARVWFARRAEWRGSLALDEFHGLHDRVTSALTFSKVPAAERSSLMEAAILDGVGLAEKLDPRRAVPIRVPREAGVVLALLIGLGALSTLEVRHYKLLPTSRRPGRRPGVPLCRRHPAAAPAASPRAARPRHSR